MKRFSLALLGTALAALLTACPSTQPPANEAPVIASFSVSPQAGAAPLQVNFSWNISDPDGDSLTCKIDADNNGTFEHTVTGCTSSSTRQHTYPAGGTYTARLVVSDPDGASDELTKTVTVGANRAPIIASFTRSPASGNAPLEVTFSWSVSDPDGDSLACILDVNGDGNAEFFLSPCTSGSQKHTYTASGTYTARLTVSDAGGLEAQQTATTTVGPGGGGNQPPVIDAFNRDPASGTAPLAVTFSWAISDPNGDPLTCKLDVNNDGTFEHTVTGCTSSSTRQHTYNAAGSYTAKLVVSDGKGLESNKTVSVTVTSSQPNRPPVISSFAGTPASGVAPLQVTFSWAISDPDGNALTCKLDVNNDGTFEYTLSNCTSSSTQKHTYGSAGSYTAKLVVSDPANASAQQTATVTVSSPNQAPAVNSFSASPSSGTAPLTTTFSWNVSDPDGDSLTCKLDVDNNGTFEYTLDNCTSGSSQQHTYGAAGSYTARLVVSDGQKENSKTTTVTVNAPGGGDPYNITLRFTGTLTTGQQAAFDAAAAKWEQVITQGFASTSLNIPADECADGLPAFNGSVDDILIDAAVVPIDGPGGVLGQAGPCYMRTADRLTLYGVMQFDSADLANLEANGLLDEVVFHEMGHVLGIGTLWNYGRSLLTGATGPDPRFVGANAVREWQALGGSGNVPVENTGGAGTRDGHWRESVFDNEVMTGYLNSGANPLSRLTIGSLQDLGYTVNYGAADPYSLPGLKASSAAKTPLNIILIKPKGSIP
ncbi:PKD domain-containing protein [Calidithermus chliarophilus]|uniref:PKD domain-containing protein n=1 Tax=Calidithermus chliarophilus TaxID=52023 RepID=UPI00040797C4|nr:PKD domain-containing protein [Calidithermus chliarophilus]